MNNIVTFKPNQKKNILIVCACICMVAIGIYLPPEDALLRWFGIAFFSLGAIIFLIAMLPNAVYLRLDEEGFERRTVLRAHKIKWSDVERFRIGSMQIASIGSAKVIEIVYSQEYKGEKVARSIAKFLSGMEDAIGEVAAPMDDVLRTMDSWRMRFGRKRI